MKIFAFFLPQFHEIEENNVWHCKGFTEWTHVKAAQALYRGHKQPKCPLDNDYYNLLQKNTVIKQTKLAEKYKIDGFIYYHYWFNGKLLMEKPAENLLRWKDIPQKFFFCWANHSFEKKWDGSNIMLQDQTYGNKVDWKKHFDYMLPFFQDDRYEKIDNKPILMLYVPDFEEKEDMFSCFDRWCKENGFEGLFQIDVYKCKVDQIPLKDKNVFAQMPSVAITEYAYQKKISYYFKRFRSKILKKMDLNCKSRFNTTSADSLYKALIKKMVFHKHLFYGLFFEWDNTPRYGKSGSVIDPLSKDVFLQYMDLLKNEKYIFVNAWNEWAEGMMLEPTKENGYRYLSWIKEWRDSRDV